MTTRPVLIKANRLGRLIVRYRFGERWWADPGSFAAVQDMERRWPFLFTRTPFWRV